MFKIVLPVMLATTMAFAADAPPTPPGKGQGHEFKALTRAKALEMAGAHFDKADANKDGVLSPEEMKAAHAARKEHMSAMREKMQGRKEKRGADAPVKP